MELICPSCEARYQVPEASIGDKGRQVSCMNCGHSWHAFPPLVLGSSSAPPASAAGGIDFQAPAPRPGRGPGSFTASDGEDRSSTSPDRPAATGLAASLHTSDALRHEPSRSEQLAEIREMLAEVQSEERAAAALAPDDDSATPMPDTPSRGEARDGRPAPGATGATGAASASTPPEWSRPAEPEAEPSPLREEAAALHDLDDEDGDTDPLRRRMAMHDRGTQKKHNNVERLRRRHDRRARRQKRASEVSSGAFFTGFLLVVMIGAAMTALYMLQPQIVARMPGAEPMLAEYVRTVDDVRGSVVEGFESARAWVLDMIEKNA